MSEPSLVPELLITDIESSINFWCTLCDFSIQYERREEGFAYLVSGNTHIMLEQRGFSRNWITGDLDVPYGRGINFQISIESVDLIVNRLQQQKWPLYMDPEEKWYQNSSTGNYITIDEEGLDKLLSGEQYTPKREKETQMTFRF